MKYTKGQKKILKGMKLWKNKGKERESNSKKNEKIKSERKGPKMQDCVLIFLHL